MLKGILKLKKNQINYSWKIVFKQKEKGYKKMGA